MIRYDVTLDQLEVLVEQDTPGWINRAQSRTDSFRGEGRYKERNTIWREVKSVFMEIQGDGKCCFCERKLESGELGRYELDIEHFRPKGKIKAWPVPQFLRKTKISFTPPPTAGHGYYLLPYHLLNYTVACKPCNSGLKKSYFPIGGTYDLNGDDPRQMRAEQPWLLYPIGHVDVDPEEVISFYGILPQSISMEPVLRQRGLVTITFFGLDDVIRRKRLMQERAMLIFCLLQQLKKAYDWKDMNASAFVKSMLDEAAAHTNCVRSFVRLFRSDRAAADRVATAAYEYCCSGSL